MKIDNSSKKKRIADYSISIIFIFTSPLFNGCFTQNRLE